MDGSQSPEITISPDLPASFDVNISSEQINELKQAGQSEQSQTILDSLFTPERRKKLIDTASRDIKGRKVRYFRKMKYDKVLDLLETGEQTHLSYFDDVHAPVNEPKLRHLLSDFSRANHLDYNVSSGNAIADDIRNSLGKIIPAEELDQAIRNLTYDQLIPLLDKYLPDTFIKGVHTGSLGQVFSPYLSMSVGGIISLSSRSYVELVMPDDQVVPHPEGVKGEKEVFTRRIKRENIARVYTSNNTLYTDEVTNPETAIGNYYERIHIGREAIERWRWDEPTADYLPTALLPLNTKIHK